MSGPVKRPGSYPIGYGILGLDGRRFGAKGQELVALLCCRTWRRWSCVRPAA